MAARKVQCTTRKASARRKTAVDPLDDEVIHEDLTNEGNPAELEGPGESGEIIKEEAPFEPKDSAMKAARAYANLKSIREGYGENGEHNLDKMDNDGMREGLKALIEDGGLIDKAMEHIKDLIETHHADLGDAGEALDKMCKSLDSVEEDQPSTVMHDVEPLEPDASTTEVKDDSFEQGEANLVDSGVVPEGDLEPIDYDDEEEGEEDKQHGSDQDTEEILERYQHPKTGEWYTRVVGKAWRAKNGRVYMKSVEQIDGGGTEPYGKDLTDDGNPAELNTPPETGAIVKDEHLDAIGKAADHLDAMASGYSASPETHGQHAEALRSVHRDLSDEGNPQELKDDPEGAAGGGDLTEGVEELKDVEKIDGHECEGGDNDDPECRVMFAAMDRGGKSAKERATKALREMNALNAELLRKSRMYGVMNGSRN